MSGRAGSGIILCDDVQGDSAVVGGRGAQHERYCAAAQPDPAAGLERATVEMGENEASKYAN